jgi:hypothetical protein
MADSRLFPCEYDGCCALSLPLLWIQNPRCPRALRLCPVCWWEDDGQEDRDASEIRLTVNGELSLHEARVHYVQYGASHPRFLPYVRKPLTEEQ